CACVAAPVAAERHDLWSEFFFCFYRHIASTSARICLFENPCRSIAPDGHVTVHAPQPWHSASLTTAIRLTSRIPWSFTSFSSYVIAPYGQTFAHWEHPLHRSSSECAVHGLVRSLSLARSPIAFTAAAPA